MIFGANGVTDYEARTVAVRENMDPAAQVKTLTHELAHVLMHDPDDQEARQHRGIREVEAECRADDRCRARHGHRRVHDPVRLDLGRPRGRPEPAQVVQATGERVRKTALAILDQLDTLQVGDGTPPGLDRDTPARASAVVKSAFLPPVDGGGAGAFLGCAGAGGEGL